MNRNLAVDSIKNRWYYTAHKAKALWEIPVAPFCIYTGAACKGVDLQTADSGRCRVQNAERGGKYYD